MNFYDLQALRPYSSRNIEAPLRRARHHLTLYTWRCLQSLSHMRFHRVVPANQKQRARHSFHRQRASRGSFERYLVRPLCVRSTNIAARCVEYETERAARHVDDVTDSTGPAGYRVSTYPLKPRGAPPMMQFQKTESQDSKFPSSHAHPFSLRTQRSLCLYIKCQKEYLGN